MLRNLIGLLLVFAASTVLLILTWYLRPKLFLSATYNKPNSYFPTTVAELNVFADYFSKYREKHFVYLVILFSLTYLYKQSFAIPGSFALNILAGALFGRWKALLLICPLNVAGASCCYLLSFCFTRPIVERFFSIQLQRLRYEVAENEYRLFSFLLFARLFPLTPHWLLNICLPLVNIPLSKFALSILIGLIPYNFLCVQAGSILSDLKDFSEVFSLTSTLQLTGLAVMVFIFSKITKRVRCTSNRNVIGLIY